MAVSVYDLLAIRWRSVGELLASCWRAVKALEGYSSKRRQHRSASAHHGRYCTHLHRVSHPFCLITSVHQHLLVPVLNIPVDIREYISTYPSWSSRTPTYPTPPLDHSDLTLHQRPRQGSTRAQATPSRSPTQLMSFAGESSSRGWLAYGPFFFW